MLPLTATGSKHSTAPTTRTCWIQTPTSFDHIFDVLDAEKIDHLLTRFAYEVDWGHHKKITLNVLAHVTRTQAHIIGYYPIVGVTQGSLTLSLGLIQLSLSLAALGAYSLMGIAAPQTFEGVLSASSHIAQGTIALVPLALGSTVYLADHTPSLEIYVQKLTLSQDKWHVICDYIHDISHSTDLRPEPDTLDMQPWAKQVVCGIEKTYTLATDGAECMVTCAAWGNLFLGAGGILAAPFTGGSSLPFAASQIAQGALALGAMSLIDQDLKTQVTHYLFPKKQDSVDATLDQLVYNVNQGVELFAEAYQAFEPRQESLIEVIAPLTGPSLSQPFSTRLTSYLPRWPFG
jgi:hypothetical protein